MPIFAALRIRNEARWIADVVRSIQPVSDEIIILDDHSDDGTPEICEQLGATVYRSKFKGLDESRDKGFLLQKAFKAIPEADQHYLIGDEASPYWCLAIDGDEVLAGGDEEFIIGATKGSVHVQSLRILYLWDQPDRVRVDGVYRSFRRPSLFRLMNRAFTYKKTPFGNGANFHCSNIPQELLHHATPCAARLLHLGYLHKEDRLRKFEWYSKIDPNNEGEGFYHHCIQGDVPEIPASLRLKWAGPMEFEALA